MLTPIISDYNLEILNQKLEAAGIDVTVDPETIQNILETYFEEFMSKVESELLNKMNDRIEELKLKFNFTESDIDEIEHDLNYVIGRDFSFKKKSFYFNYLESTIPNVNDVIDNHIKVVYGLKKYMEIFGQC